MRKGSGLSAGELVTYQLYFNKIQSSYNQLVNLLSSFTRAGGAAQRVLGTGGRRCLARSRLSVSLR